MTHSGGKPHEVGDRGQRYEVRFIDSNGHEHVMGWTNNEENAAGMVRSINKHSVWHSPKIIDRHQLAGDESIAAEGDEP